jgi:hypothetical protein
VIVAVATTVVDAVTVWVLVVELTRLVAVDGGLDIVEAREAVELVAEVAVCVEEPLVTLVVDKVED